MTSLHQIFPGLCLGHILRKSLSTHSAEERGNVLGKLSQNIWNICCMLLSKVSHSPASLYDVELPRCFPPCERDLVRDASWGTRVLSLMFWCVRCLVEVCGF
jgi:hypothetical protein